MGLFDFLRRNERRAMPDPGSPEFERTVEGSALPGSKGLQMGEAGWSSVGDAASAEELARAAADRDLPAPGQGIDVGDAEIREEVRRVLREHGVDPDDGGRVDASKVPGVRRALLMVLRGAGVNIPGLDGTGTTVAGGPGGFSVSTPNDPTEQVQALERARDEGRVSEAEYEALRRRLPDSG